MDLVVRNARLRGRKGSYDIGIMGSKIVEVKEKISGTASEELDAQGCLALPAFIDPHIHLDKVLVIDRIRPNVSGTLQEAIEILWEAKSRYTTEDVKSRARKVIEMEVKHGVTRIRTHVDVDPICGLTPLRALLELKQEVKDLVDLQVVAFPQEGIVQSEGTEELLYKAMELGADVVGGMPHNEMTDDDSKKHVDIVFEIAKHFNADIDAHVDETDDPYSRCVEYMAAKAIKENYKGRVSADHVCALASYDDYHAAKVVSLIKKAEMNVETNPETNAVLEGRLDTYPKRRGLTRVKQLLKAGVNVTYGQDCVKDAFYPFGKADPLLTGFVLALFEQMTTPEEIGKIIDMCTYNAAKMIGVASEYGIEPGKRADIVVVKAENELEAIRLQPPRLFTIKAGKITYRHNRV